MSHPSFPTPISYTVVVPVFNSATNLDSIVNDFEQYVIEAGFNATLIFVDDASNEATRNKVEEVALKKKFATAIRLKKNIGQLAATACGIHHAQGDVIITMDDDLQYPMQEVPKLINHYLRSGKTIVFGYPRKRMQGFRHKMIVQLIIWLFDYILMPRYRKINFYTPFRIFNRSLFFTSDNQIIGRHLLYLWEIPAGKMDSMPVAHNPRSKGKSTYTFIKKIRIFWPALVFSYVRLSLIIMAAAILCTLLARAFGMNDRFPIYPIAAAITIILLTLLPASFFLERGKNVEYEIEKIIK